MRVWKNWNPPIFLERTSLCKKGWQFLKKLKTEFPCVPTHFSTVWLFATLWTTACQAPLPMKILQSRILECLPCSPPGDLPDSGLDPIALTSPALAGRFFTTSTTWEEFPYSLAIPFPGIYPRQMKTHPKTHTDPSKTHPKTCMWMFTVAYWYSLKNGNS